MRFDVTLKHRLGNNGQTHLSYDHMTDSNVTSHSNTEDNGFQNLCIMPSVVTLIGFRRQTQHKLGTGTYYWYTEDGTCSYPPPELPPVAKHPGITDFVALNRPQFFGSLACGMCFSVNGSGVGLGLNPIIGQHIVFVKDMCPECKTGMAMGMKVCRGLFFTFETGLAGDIDFSQTADGRWNISFQAIQCPVGNTSIEYKLQGSNTYYLKLQVRNARIPATFVEMSTPDLSWFPLEHTTDGFWVARFPKGVTYPLNLRLTAANGEVIQDTLSMDYIVNEKVLQGNGVQFTLDNSLPMLSYGNRR
ncbi:uncharacterized protein LOC132546808 [Ylistrum balloti]|uniref:uncharacterized protein LOC132546808 n=1 Tax=Ylistrum balloti TaxID=509963 RepID=UPI002905ADAB|nr:uncharacterized protein LOC132546808 [Ylistrum balloti]